MDDEVVVAHISKFKFDPALLSPFVGQQGVGPSNPRPPPLLLADPLIHSKVLDPGREFSSKKKRRSLS